MISRGRIEELKMEFDKAWAKKVRHDNLFSSQLPINIEKTGRTPAEVQLLQRWLTMKEQTYVRKTPVKYPNTRQKSATTKPNSLQKSKAKTDSAMSIIEMISHQMLTNTLKRGQIMDNCYRLSRNQGLQLYAPRYGTFIPRKT